MNRAQIARLSKKWTVPSIPYFVVSALLLLLSFTDPKNKWTVNFGFFGLSETIDVYGDLFIFCMVLYIPMMAFAFCFFVKAIVVFIRTKSFQCGTSLLVASIVGVIALYRFDRWVFSEIY